MFPEKLRSSVVFLAMLQWYYGFAVTAENTETRIISRGDNALASFGQTVPILGLVSAECLDHLTAVAGIEIEELKSPDQSADGTYRPRLRRWPSP